VKVSDYWERKFRKEVAHMTLLTYFKPCYMSLTKPHTIWTSARENPYEVSKAVIQARMLSGRYRTKLLTSNWLNSQDVYCPVPQCTEVESIQQIHLDCQAYAITRTNVVKKWLSVEDPVVAQFGGKFTQHNFKNQKFIKEKSAADFFLRPPKTNRGPFDLVELGWP
jgi:hypothetical protein